MLSPRELWNFQSWQLPMATPSYILSKSTSPTCLALGLADRYAEKEADLSLAAGILQKANLQLEQRIKINQSLQKQLKNLQEEKEPAPPKAEGLFEKLGKFYQN